MLVLNIRNTKLTHRNVNLQNYYDNYNTKSVLYPRVRVFSDACIITFLNKL